MNLVVVSNRVSSGKPNEPMTGGLAAALLPVVENSGAIWVGSSGRVRDGLQKEPLAEIQAAVLEAVHKFAGDELEDDLTLLVVRAIEPREAIQPKEK